MRRPIESYRAQRSVIAEMVSWSAICTALGYGIGLLLNLSSPDRPGMFDPIATAALGSIVGGTIGTLRAL